MQTKLAPSVTPEGFTIHSLENAPAGSKEILSSVQKAFGGSLPNLFGVMAASPQLVAGNAGLMSQLESLSLSPLEQQVIELAVSEKSRCEYCVAAHTFLARRLPQDPIQAARSGQEIADPKLEALRRFAIEASSTHGFPTAEARKTFFGHYSHQQALEVILVISVKTLQNLVNNIAQTPIDAMFLSSK